MLFGSGGYTLAKYGKFPYIALPRSLKLLQEAIDTLGYKDRVKTIMTHTISGVLTLNGTRPSDASFLPEVKESMLEILNFLNYTNTPFIFDFFPTGYVTLYDVDMEFAFFDNKSTYSITDVNGLQYHNALDAAYDSFVWALTKVGFGHLKISVGQIGWPTDGAVGANVKDAERFWKGLLPRVTRNVGTPMRPGIEMDIFIHSLVDDMKAMAMNPFTRHWGIYRSNGQPKYKIDFTGQGRDIYPSRVMGIDLMPARWCIFNGNENDFGRAIVQKNFNFACQAADCTTLLAGGSCSILSHKERVSYAFNNYFQFNYQDEEACNFDGLGTVTVVNPSRDTCVFMIGVVKGNKQTDPTTR